MIEGLPDFLNHHRHGSNEHWLAGLIENDWLAVDWPVAYGGPGLTRQGKLDFIRGLGQNGCPLLPDSVTVIAPLLLSLGSEAQKQTALASIKINPDDWQLVIEDATVFVRHDNDRIQLGETGKADVHLAACCSSLFQVHMLTTSLARIKDMNSHWGEDAADDVSGDVTKLEILLSSLETMYLQDEPRKDLQIALKANQAAMQTYALLFQLLGYYALLDPDQHLTGNENIPFQKERDHLYRLRQQIGRSEMNQQDLIFKRYLESS